MAYWWVIEVCGRRDRGVVEKKIEVCGREGIEVPGKEGIEMSGSEKIELCVEEKR